MFGRDPKVTVSWALRCGFTTPGHTDVITDHERTGKLRQSLLEACMADTLRGPQDRLARSCPKTTPGPNSSRCHSWHAVLYFKAVTSSGQILVNFVQDPMVSTIAELEEHKRQLDRRHHEVSSSAYREVKAELQEARRYVLVMTQRDERELAAADLQDAAATVKRSARRRDGYQKVDAELRMLLPAEL